MAIRNILKGASAPMALCVLLAANPVLAQGDANAEDVLITDAADEPADAETDAELGTRTSSRDGTIVVTGSLIRRTEFTAPAPLTVINPETAARQGLLNTADMIQGSPIAAGSSQVTAALSGQFLVNGGQGVQTVSLRGLGAERTLVLLNGRRAGPAGTRGAISAFDLNVLPFSVVQTIEVLKDGASSLYGSDAVAGVVNIITKTDTDGVEFDMFGSAPFKSGGEQFSAAATWGKTFDRGHILVSGNYFRQNELARGDRSYLQCSEANVFTDRTYDTRADLIDPRTGDYACGGADSNVQWGHVWTYDYSSYFSDDGTSNIPGSDGNGESQLLQYSYPGSNLGQYIPPVGPAGNGQIDVPAGWYNVGYDPASRAVLNGYHPLMNRDTLTPTTDRYTLYLDAAYELTDAVEVYTELLYNKRKTSFNASGQVYQFGVGETNGGLYPPFVVDPLAVGFGGPALFSPTAFIDWFDSSQEVDYYRGVIGFRGDISSTWSYDVYGQYSKSDASYTNQRILADSMATQDFRTGSCVGDVTPIGGRDCVDVLWHTPRVMYGDFIPAEFNFLTDTETGTTQYTQKYVQAAVTGDVFNLPYGTVKMAGGGTFRRDEINDTPGAISLAGNVWNGGAAGITAGRSDTLEAFGEVNIPLLADLPLIERRTITGAARVTSVKATRASDGVSASDNGNWTYKLQGDWELTDWLRVRGTYGTSYRAPALFEQFLSDQVGSLDQRSVDPCIQWGVNLANGDISQRLADNCAADGVSTNHTGSGIPAFSVTGGGLGVLDSETSTAWTASLILTPRFSFLPNTRISVAVDYFDIEVKGEIAQYGARNLLAGCYTSDFFPDEPLCDQFDRIQDLDPSNPYWNSGDGENVAVIRDSFININSQKNRGVDVTTRIVHDFAGDVTLSLEAQMTWQTKDEIAVFSGLPENLNGEAGEPRWVGDFNARLSAGPWSLFYGLDVIGATNNYADWLDANGPANPTPQQIDDTLCPQFTVYPNPVCLKLETPATFYHSASVSRDLGDNFRITAGVSNIFDTRPPRTTDTGGDGIQNYGKGVAYSQYDLLGRRAFMNIKVKY